MSPQVNFLVLTIAIIMGCVFYRSKLDQVLDFENGGVPLHLGKIADSMHEWEGPIAEQLGLTLADVAAIKTKHPFDLRLQT